MSLISVIVPIYNVEKYLEKCLDSILNQTFKDMEVILINDGSTDGCLDICKKYEKKDSRIHIIDKKNTGLSDSRNRGIDYAKSPYLLFVDSDDWINYSMIEILYDSIIRNNADIAECKMIYAYDESDYINQESYKEYIIQSKEEALERLYKFKDETGVNAVVVWNKLYKKELFKKIEFPINKLHEDEFIAHKLIDTYKTIVIINQALYYYRQRENSITKSDFVENKMDAIDALIDRGIYLKANGYKSLDIKNNFYIYTILNKYLTEIKRNSLDKFKHIESIITFLIRYFSQRI